MKITATLLLTALVAHAQPLFIGTNADGIYISQFDAEAGTLTEPKLAAEIKQPGFLAFHPEKPLLYAIAGDNKVASFTIGDDNSLTQLDTRSSGGGGPCHLAIDPTGNTVAVANYGDGSVTTIRLDDEGKFGDVVTKYKIQGSGPDKSRQKSAHTHGVYFDQAGKFLFAPDLGADKTAAFAFDSSTSTFEPTEQAELKAPPGSGPRHMAFSPDESHAYIINELTGTVTVAEFNKETGALKDIQTIDTLPSEFEEFNETSEIEVHPNGNFVYGSNRGHESIVVYKRDPKSGLLTFLQHAPCGGKTPRHFKIDPSGKWLICAHQDSETISVLALDPETGMLGEPKSTVSAPSPICVLFE